MENHLAGRGALAKRWDATIEPTGPGARSAQEIAAADDAPGAEQALYHLGMHLLRYRSADGVLRFIPTMQGSGENQVVLYPNGLVSIIAGKAADAVVDGQPVKAGDYAQTLRVLDRLGPLPQAALH